MTPTLSQFANPGRLFQVMPAVADCDYRVPQAGDRAGLLVAWLDGHTSWVRPSVTPAAFWAAVTPAGGESIPID